MPAATAPVAELGAVRWAAAGPATRRLRGAPVVDPRSSSRAAAETSVYVRSQARRSKASRARAVPSATVGLVNSRSTRYRPALRRSSTSPRSVPPRSGTRRRSLSPASFPCGPGGRRECSTLIAGDEGRCRQLGVVERQVTVRRSREAGHGDHGRHGYFLGRVPSTPLRVPGVTSSPAFGDRAIPPKRRRYGTRFCHPCRARDRAFRDTSRVRDDSGQSAVRNSPKGAGTRVWMSPC